jgi:hypothetical protein
MSLSRSISMSKSMSMSMLNFPTDPYIDMDTETDMEIQKSNVRYRTPISAIFDIMLDSAIFNPISEVLISVSGDIVHHGYRNECQPMLFTIRFLYYIPAYVNVVKAMTGVVDFCKPFWALQCGRRHSTLLTRYSHTHLSYSRFMRMQQVTETVCIVLYICVYSVHIHIYTSTLMHLPTICTYVHSQQPLLVLVLLSNLSLHFRKWLPQVVVCTSCFHLNKYDLLFPRMLLL